MNSLAVLVALLLPLAIGVAVLMALLGRPADKSGYALLFGSGWILGAIALGAALRFAAPLAISAWFSTLIFPLSAGTAAGLFLAWRRRAVMPSKVTRQRWGWLGWILLALLAIHGVLLLVEAWSLPTLPWDAWTTWIGKAKAWYGADRLLPWMTPDDWAGAAPENARATLAPHYPDALPRLILWGASAYGAWNEAALHLLWPLLWITTGLGLYGHLRRDGLDSTWALAGTFGCLSLPLVNTHIALAGYADFWLAAMLLFAILHLARWTRERKGRELAAAALFALLLPAIKLEGGIWLLCLAAAAVWAALPRGWRWGLPVAGILITAIGMAAGGLPIPAPGLGTVTLAWGEVRIPAMGHLALFWRPVGEQVFASLFALPNWHLLWYLLPLAMIWRGQRLYEDRGLQAIAAFLALSYGFLFMLFFFTDASAWAENLTSINRVVLHVAPASVILLVMLAAPTIRGTDFRFGR